MLPKTLKYGSKVESAPARSSRSNIAPQNGTSGYNLGDIITINIPTRANLVMAPTECYLKFDIEVRNTSGANCNYKWDSCGAHGLIQRIRVWSGSNLLEDIDNYGLLAKMLFDLQVPTDAAYGKFNIMCGTRNDLVVLSNGSIINPAADATAITQNINGGLYSANQVNSGETLGIAVGNNTNTTLQTYNLNLISVLGSLCNTSYFPLFACTSAPIRLEIQLVDNLNKAMNCTSNTGSIIMSNVEYVANFIELSDVAMSMINQSLGGQPLQFVIPEFRNYAWSGATLPNGTSSAISIPIPAKFSSLKSLFITTRDRSTGANTFFPFSSVSAGISEYNFRVGPNTFPPKAPNRLTEMFCETCKAIGSIADLNHQPSIEKSSYTLRNSPSCNSEALLNSTNSGSFYIGLDLENYSSAPKDTIFAGYNSNTDDIFCNISYGGAGASTIGTTTTAGISYRWDAFANFDCVFVFENNTSYIRF